MLPSLMHRRKPDVEARSAGGGGHICDAGGVFTNRSVEPAAPIPVSESSWPSSDASCGLLEARSSGQVAAEDGNRPGLDTLDVDCKSPVTLSFGGPIDERAMGGDDGSALYVLLHVAVLYEAAACREQKSRPAVAIRLRHGHAKM